MMAACATIHPGVKVPPKSETLPLAISAQTLEGRPSETFQLVEVTLENVAPTWVKVDKSEVVIDHPETSKVSLVVGKDLVDWAKAMELRSNQENHNKNMWQLGLVGLGAITALTSPIGSDSQKAGLAAAGVGTGWMAVDSVDKSHKKGTRVNHVPDNHLCEPFAIPGKMYLRRWVLINKPVGTMLDKLVVRFETVDGEKETYVLQL